MNDSSGVRSLVWMVAFATGLTANWTMVAAPLQMKLLQGEGRWPAFRGGVVYSVCATNLYAYVAMGTGGLQIFDGNDPSKPTLISYYADEREDAEFVQVSGNYAYVLAAIWPYQDSRALWVIDVGEPAHPRLRGRCVFDAMGPTDFTINGNYAYVADPEGEGLWMIDISDPAAPAVATVVWGDSESVSVAGNYAYYGPQIFDVSNPARPVLIRDDNKYGLFQGAGRYAYGGDYDNFNVLDLSNPTNLVSLGSCTVQKYSHLQVKGDYAYLLGYNQSSRAALLQIIQISNLTNLIPVGLLWLNSDSHLSFSVSGDYAYVIAGGLRVIDVSDPTAPLQIGQVVAGGWVPGFSLQGKYAYVIDGGLHVLDVSDPLHPVNIGACSLPNWITEVRLLGNYAYGFEADWDPAFQIFDISAPTSPQWVGSFITDSNVVGMEIVGSIAYVVHRDQLQVLDASNPTAPVTIGRYPFNHIYDAHGLGSYVYVLTWHVFHVLDATDPAHPREIGSCPVQGLSFSTDGHYAYLVQDWEDSPDYPCIVDVSNPAMPLGLSGGGYFYGGIRCRIIGHYLYIVDAVESDYPWSEWYVLDVSDPAHAVRLYTFGDRAGTSTPLWIDGFLYLARGYKGLSIMPYVPNVERTFQLSGLTPGPLTIESATDLAGQNPWAPLLTTNVAASSLFFSDYEIRNVPKKLYRARQP